MASFEPGDVIKVPFPYTDKPARQSRPALVVSIPALEATHGLLWVGDDHQRGKPARAAGSSLSFCLTRRPAQSADGACERCAR